MMITRLISPDALLMTLTFNWLVFVSYLWCRYQLDPRWERAMEMIVLVQPLWPQWFLFGCMVLIPKLLEEVMFQCFGRRGSSLKMSLPKNLPSHERPAVRCKLLALLQSSLLSLITWSPIRDMLRCDALEINQKLTPNFTNFQANSSVLTELESVQRIYYVSYVLCNACNNYLYDMVFPMTISLYMLLTLMYAFITGVV